MLEYDNMKTELQTLINTCSSELTDIDNKISALPPLDKSRFYLTQYALIRTCGTVEFVYRSIVADYFDQFPVPQVHTYIENTVRIGSMSATYENMCKLLKKFDGGWCSNFKAAVQRHQHSNRIISSATSLVNNRHLFAHGKPPTATFRNIYDYYLDTLELIRLLDGVVQ